VTILIGVITLIAQFRAYVERKEEREHSQDTFRQIWRNMQPSLKALLFSDIFIRAAESLTDVFLVLYATDVAGVKGVEYGALISVAKATSILVYIPFAKWSDQFGRKPFALMTFVFFALFPLTVALSATWTGLLIAFIINGLREIGEPPRKAMIVDLADPAARGRTVGLYYLIRSLAIAPGAAVGGRLYTYDPHLPFYLAFAAGVGGALLFALTVKEK
jgi:MFS family permease